MSVRSSLTRTIALIGAGPRRRADADRVRRLVRPVGQLALARASSAASGARRRPARLRLRGAAAGGRSSSGSANFPESALLANIYAAALTAKGVEATTNLNIGERAVYLKALQDGSIDLVPEYSGVLLQYFDPDRHRDLVRRRLRGAAGGGARAA